MTHLTTSQQEAKQALASALRKLKSLSDRFLGELDLAESDLSIRKLASDAVSHLNDVYWNVSKLGKTLNIIGYVVRIMQNERISLPPSCKNVISALKKQFKWEEERYWVRFFIPKGTLGVVVGMQGNSFEIGLLNKEQKKIFSKYSLYLSADKVDTNVSAEEAKEFSEAKAKYFVRKGYDNFAVVEQMSKTKGA